MIISYKNIKKGEDIITSRQVLCFSMYLCSNGLGLSAVFQVQTVLLGSRIVIVYIYTEYYVRQTHRRTQVDAKAVIGFPLSVWPNHPMTIQNFASKRGKNNI